MNAICFFVEPTDRVRISLRRYVSSEREKCDRSGLGYHDAVLGPIGESPAAFAEREDRRVLLNPFEQSISRQDERWPAECACGRAFTEADEWQVWQDLLYRRTDTGAIVTLRDKVPGMMWDAWWHPKDYKGQDGRSLCVVLPNGHEWMIDGRASNCTKPQDREHRCWVRHGEPPVLTVDKNGNTCAAGAGSIGVPGWHGFLRNGVLEEC